MMNCLHCNKEFQPTSSLNQKFCSAKCFHAFRLDTGHFYICPTCRKRFKSHWKIIPVRFCSRACRNKSLVKAKPVFTCQNCNKEFTIRFPGVTRKAKFCSRDCWREWCDKTAKKHICIYCKQSFKSGNSNPKFCSQKCYWLYRGPSSIE